MKFKTVLMILAASAAISGCSYFDDMMASRGDRDYWQRVEDSSAIYMTGIKAQRKLDEDIASCVNQIDELVKLNATRTVPPSDPNSDYRVALKNSGEYSSADNPTTAGKKKVDHSDFYDYESCMRAQGWERVTYMRYQTAANARATYRETQSLRKTKAKTASAPVSIGNWTLVQ